MTAVDSAYFVPLPLLLYAKPAQRLELFAKKIKACCQNCNFNDSGADLKKKEMKRIYLNECIEFLKDRKEIFIEPIYALIFALFGHNVFRTLPSKYRNYNPELDDHVGDPSWPHLELVYIFFIRVLEAPDFQACKAKKFLNCGFIGKVIDSFASDDVNERQYLKKTLHRLYKKFISMRAFMRKEICHQCQLVIYNNHYLPGIVELLEVLGSICNGFICPIKIEHINILHQVLLPLHSLPSIAYFHSQLVYCVVQFLEKDANLTGEVLRKFLKKWPKTASGKELLFLDELEEIVDCVPLHQFEIIYEMVFKQIAHCIRSNNSQVSERALCFWQNEYIVSYLEMNSRKVYPIILPSLVEASKYHWNLNITRISKDIIQIFLKYNEDTSENILKILKNNKKVKELKRKDRQKKWHKIEKEAKRNSMYTIIENT